MLPDGATREPVFALGRTIKTKAQAQFIIAPAAFANHRRARRTGPVRPPGRGVRWPFELRPRREARPQSSGHPPSDQGIRQTGPRLPGALSGRGIRAAFRAVRDQDPDDDLGGERCVSSGGEAVRVCLLDRPGYAGQD